MQQLWLKYQPNTLADMVGLDGLKGDAGSWAVAGALRCGGVIFHGGPGTGKTSASRAIGRDMLGGTFDANFHVFNASDDRGIAFVRDRLKALAEQKAINYPFKIILLDEADGLTKDAQDAMRQVIELTSPHTMWILTCNRIGRIIPPIRSRLPAYSFGGLDGDEAEDFLKSIIEEEGFPTEWLKSVPTLLNKHKGDLRACLKTLQVCNPKSPNGLVSLIRDDLLIVEKLYADIKEEEWTYAMETADEIHRLGIGRDEIISAIHEGIISTYKHSDWSDQHKTLRHLMILGQWAARSPDWVSGELLFLHAIIGDYQHRG